jgi:hypothetical protein
MTAPVVDQSSWIRKCTLLLTSATEVLDLSQLRIGFEIKNADVESPNNAVIRVYNLSPATVTKIKGEFNSVILNAGYENSSFGAIFQGTIKQFKVGRVSNVDTYLDIYASDGDIGYNSEVVNQSFAAGTTPRQVSQALGDQIGSMGSDFGSLLATAQYTPSIRGQVQFGMARARLRNMAYHLDASWSIQNGQVVMIDNTGYRDGDVININVQTGMIGQPEQTDGGIRVRTLLDPRYRIGCQIKLDNSTVNQIIQNTQTSTPYNRWTGVQQLAPISADGLYRVFVADYVGDNRGNDWYSELTVLAVTPNPNNRLDSVAPL